MSKHAHWHTCCGAQSLEVYRCDWKHNFSLGRWKKVVARRKNVELVWKRKRRLEKCVIIFTRNIRVTRRWVNFSIPPWEKSCNCRARPRLPGGGLISPSLDWEMCCKLASHVDVFIMAWFSDVRGCSRSLRFPHSPDGYKVRVMNPQERLRWRLLLGLLASSCIIRGVNSSLFIYFKTIQACNDCERFGIEGKQSTVDTTRDFDSWTRVSVSFVFILFSHLQCSSIHP